MAQIIIVFELPPNAFCKILVKFESLYGTTAFLDFPWDFSARTLIQVPNTVRLLLIAEPSFNLKPSAPVYPAFSEPARSTRFMHENFSTFLPYSVLIYLNSIVITVWARLDVWFIYVAPIERLVYPSSIFFAINSYESTACFVKSWT
jgi:hypothetical protein